MNKKKIAMLLLAAVMLLGLAACGSTAQSAGSFQTRGEAAPPAGAGDEDVQPNETPGAGSDDPAQPDDAEEGGRVLIAYFSATNHTKDAAQKLADGLGADLYEIRPEQPYTEADINYGDPNSRSSAEMNDPAARPAISGQIPDMAQYDIVLIGYPIWWGEAPRIMSTFVESCDLSGKTLAAFCTSASSGFGSSDSALRAAAGTASWLDGRRFSAGASAEDLLGWAGELGLWEG